MWFRTGRFGKPGIAINLVDSEIVMDYVRKFESYFGSYFFLYFVITIGFRIFIGISLKKFNWLKL